jgi:hypothetical protein
MRAREMLLAFFTFGSFKRYFTQQNCKLWTIYCNSGWICFKRISDNPLKIAVKNCGKGRTEYQFYCIRVRSHTNSARDRGRVRLEFYFSEDFLSGGEEFDLEVLQRGCTTITVQCTVVYN